MSNLNEHQFAHRPTDYGGLHEADKAYPDVYEHPEYYASGEPGENQTVRMFRSARGEPDKKMWAWRAGPKSVYDDPTRTEPWIRPGDWISPSKEYAQEHAAKRTEETGEKFVVHGMRVPAKHIRLTGDYIPEAGYDPSF